MFIKDTDLIEVKVNYKKTGGRNKYLAFTDSELAKYEGDKTGYSVLTVKMKELSWGLYNDLQEEGVRQNEDGAREFNFKMYKENKLKKLIKEWDAKDSADKPVSVSEMAIIHLSPYIAEAIIRGYDELNTISEEKEKN